MLSDPAILFFVFGLAAGFVKSRLEIPPQIARFLSLYLLMALGLKGGFALAATGLTAEVTLGLACALALAIVVPVIGWQVLRRLVSPFDAAALAATYGSVSAVTFITAVQVLAQQGVPHGGHMAAALALMESPAIVIAVLLANLARRKAALAAGGPADARAGKAAAQAPTSLKAVLHEAFTDGAQLLLLGAMVIGVVTGAAGEAAMKPFAGDLFKGMLSFFLLDMGLSAARQLKALGRPSPLLLAYAVLAPLAHAALALGLAWAVGMPAGDGALLMVLAASASYIAVPAVVRDAIPEAQPTLYLGLSLGVTFPFNILFGIGLYLAVAQRVLG